MSGYYSSHFVRGVFDGDGYVQFYKNKENKNEFMRASLSIAGTENICNGIKNITSELDIKTYITKHKTADVYYFNIYGVNQVFAFLNWIYKDATRFLTRKEEIYRDIKKYCERNK
jgi:hypothetical protein